MRVFIVFRLSAETQQFTEFLSAWPNPYAARYESNRLEEETKIPHIVVEGTLGVDW